MTSSSKSGVAILGPGSSILDLQNSKFRLGINVNVSKYETLHTLFVRFRCNVTPRSLSELKGQLSDGREEVLDPATFEQREDGVFYVRLVRNGFKTSCRLSSSQYHELALECEPTEMDGYPDRNWWKGVAHR